ncbi:MAG TPA: ABC transporter permease [Planctomycetota bacterium]|jgi:ABC-type Na+ efflux pump permease subunit|nr:ABC transporter permease [Planctomycetota bacterium]
MIRDAVFIARNELSQTLRQRETIVWIFLMPIVFFYFIGTVTGGFGGGGDRKTPIAVRAGEDGGFLSAEIERRLSERGYAVTRVEDDAAFAKAARRIEIPARLTATVLGGTPAHVRFHGGEEGLDGDFDALKVRRAVYTVLADLVATSDGGKTPGRDDFAALAQRPRALTLAATSAGKRVDPPVGFEQTIPGTMTMFTLIVLLTSGAVRLAIERRDGQLRRLASTPISRGDIVLGKWAGRLGLGLVQIAVAMVTGVVLFRMHWGSAFPMVCVVMFAWASLAASLSLVLGSIARTDGQAIAIGVLTSNVLAALGGCWWPIEITPPFMQKLAGFLPTGWTMHALHGLVSFRAGWASAVPDVIALAVGALVAGWIAARLFRFQ